MNQIQSIRQFAAIVIGEKITISNRRLQDTWEIAIGGKSPYLYLPCNLNYKGDEWDKMFREDFVSKYTPANSLSDITISLLHELGHWMTRFDFDEEEDLRERRVADTPQKYLALQCEMLATAWAIEWLSNHYDLAKQFDSELTFA